MTKKYTVVCEKCGAEQVTYVPTTGAWHLTCKDKGTSKVPPKMVEKPQS